MVSVNALTREIHLKIVYYGPGLGGKTTTLQYIHDTTDPNHRGKMVSLATPVERTLYFDYLPVHLPAIGGYALKLQLFTVPGQIHFNATRKLVLSNADGVVFIADSQRSRWEANLESFDNLLFNLSDYKIDVNTFPIVFHYNKRDLSDIVSLSEMETDLNRRGRPSLSTCALKGTNVYEGLELITKEVLRSLKRKGASPESPRSTSVVETAPTLSNTMPPVSEAPEREKLPLEVAVSKIADRSSSSEAARVTGGSVDAVAGRMGDGDGSPLSMDRPTIPAPFALSEKVVSEQSRSRFSGAFQTAASPPVSATRFTFVPLWPEAARKRGMEIESAVSERRYLEAIRLILVELDLIITVHRRGNEIRSAETVIAMLGMDSARYRIIADLATAPATEISLRHVLHAYLFLLELIEKSR